MLSGRTVRGRGRGGRSRNQSFPYTPPSSRSPTPVNLSSGESIVSNTLQELQQASASGSTDDSTLPPSPWSEFQHSPSPQEVGPSGSGSTPPPPLNLPQGRDPTNGKTWIYPQGASFTPVVNVVRDITAVIQAKYMYDYVF